MDKAVHAFLANHECLIWTPRSLRQQAVVDEVARQLEEPNPIFCHTVSNPLSPSQKQAVVVEVRLVAVECRQKGPFAVRAFVDYRRTS